MLYGASPGLSLILSWVFVFLFWVGWESFFRVFLFHPSWNIQSAFSYTLANLGWAFVCGIAGGCVHFATSRFVAKARIQIRPNRTWIVLFVVPFFLLLILQGVRTYSGIERVAGPAQRIVLISIDTLRHDYVGVYGAQIAKTPVMNEVASQGARFEVAIAPVPETGPSHATMLTGQAPQNHGSLFNGQPLVHKQSNLALQLRKAGFKTAAFISGFPLRAINSGLDEGFQEYNDQLALKDHFQEIYLGVLADWIPFFRRGVYRQAPEVTQEALHWLDQNTQDSFFLFLHYFDPHYPYGEKAKWRNAKRPLYIRAKPGDVERQKQLYAQEVELVDTQIRRVIQLLQSRGVYDQTLFLIVADHGESLGEHKYFYDHGKYVYEQMVRVPLIIRCPKLVQSARVIQEPVAVMDVYRTIVRAAGLKPRPQTDGYDLLQLARQIPGEYDRWVLSQNFQHRVTGIRGHQWKLIGTEGKNGARFELYDVLNDPGESVNLYGQNEDISKKLRNKMNEMMASLKNVRSDEWSTENLTTEQIESLKSLGYLD